MIVYTPMLGWNVMFLSVNLRRTSLITSQRCHSKTHFAVKYPYTSHIYCICLLIHNQKVLLNWGMLHSTLTLSAKYKNVCISIFSCFFLVDCCLRQTLHYMHNQNFMQIYNSKKHKFMRLKKKKCIVSLVWHKLIRPLQWWGSLLISNFCSTVSNAQCINWWSTKPVINSTSRRSFH